MKLQATARLLPFLILLIGGMLRVSMITQPLRFHPDEALYATFARRIALHGDFLLSDAALDKPPLMIDVMAVSFSVFGVNEPAARLPSFFADLITLALLYAIVKRLYDRRTALLAMLILALSPFDLYFTATAFVDPLLVCWIMLALWCAATQRARSAGIAIGLAIATKQSALQFVPLVIAVWVCCDHPLNRRVLRRFLLPIAGIVSLLVVWSVARAAPIDFWTLGSLNNNPGRLIRSDEIIPRLLNWLFIFGETVGFGPILLLLGIPAWATLRMRDRAARFDGLFLTYLIASFFAYWLIAFNVYDRYALPFVPLIALLAARGIINLPPRRNWEGYILAGLVILFMLPATLHEVNGDLPLADFGSARNAYTGIDLYAVQLNRFTVGDPVYEHWLGWELDYYLGEASPTTLIWLPSPDAFARTVCSEGRDRAYFAAPANESGVWLEALDEARLNYDRVVGGQYELYAIRCH
jgi:4-amino-4-deoxy-L-arabinose transferase-like glycosyltransferase